jgi:hypothetical protein
MGKIVILPLWDHRPVHPEPIYPIWDAAFQIIAIIAIQSEILWNLHINYRIFSTEFRQTQEYR